MGILRECGARRRNKIAMYLHLKGKTSYFMLLPLFGDNEG